MLLDFTKNAGGDFERGQALFAGNGGLGPIGDAAEKSFQLQPQGLVRGDGEGLKSMPNGGAV